MDFGGVFGGVFLEWFGTGAKCGVERRNDRNHFWFGVLGVLELWIRKINLERRTMGGVGGGRGRGETVVVERAEGSWRFHSS